MNTYETLIGYPVDLGGLAPRLVALVHRLVGAREASTASEREPRSIRYARQARQILQGEAPIRQDYLQLVRGPVGDVYRDGYYRLAMEEYVEAGKHKQEDAGERRSRFITTLRTDPARPLFDHYLEGGWSQREFGQLAELDPGTVSKLFGRIRNPDSEAAPGTAVDRLREAFEHMKITSRYQFCDPVERVLGKEKELLSPYRYVTVEPSTRERWLALLVAATTHKIQEKDTPKAPPRSLAFNLTAIYGLRDVVRFKAVTSAFWSIITRARDSSTKLFFKVDENSLAEQVGANYGHSSIDDLALFCEGQDTDGIPDKSRPGPPDVPGDFLSIVEPSWSRVKMVFGPWYKRLLKDKDVAIIQPRTEQFAGPTNGRRDGQKMERKSLRRRNDHAMKQKAA